jgi:hypothetical protein
MSHLGDRLSAFVDGELDGAERDKASAHLARCEQCRAEAASLRDLKRQLRALAADSSTLAAAEMDVTRRLMAMTGIGSTQPPRRRLRVLSRTPRGLRPPGPGPGPGLGGRGGSPGPRAARRHRRYLVFGTVSIVVGLGTAAFTAGGGDPGPGPKITPQMELYSEEHAITTGEVPFAGVPGAIEGGAGPADAPGTGQPASTSPSALDSGGPAQQP